MSAKKPALGRGLDALFGARPPAAVAAPPPPAPGPIQETGSLRQLAIDQIQPNPFQPRTTFEPDKIAELADSIRQMGVLQPIIVRSRAGFFELIAGERRWRAAQQAGLHQIPALVRDFSDQEMTEAAIIENIQRDDLNAVDEARGYETLAVQFQMTQEAIATAVGRSRVAITNSLRLLRLPSPILDMLKEGRITAGQARPLLSIEAEATQVALAREIVEKGLSARDAESRVKRLLKADPPNAKKTSPNGASPANFSDIQEKLTLQLGMQIKIIPKSNAAGRVEVYYSSLDEFEKFCEQMGLTLSELL